MIDLLSPSPSTDPPAFTRLTSGVTPARFSDTLSASLPYMSFRSFLFIGLTALVSLLCHLWLCQFFTFGVSVPLSIDINPSNLWKYAYVFPPRGSFLILNWFGTANPAPPLTFFSLLANLPPWLFLTTYMPLMATLALLAMMLFLRELELSRPAALFGGVVYAWQGDLIPFILPGHFAYAALWPILAVAAWSVLRLQRTGRWGYALISGLGCGMMVELLPDRGGIASLFIATLYLSQVYRSDGRVRLPHFFLCVGVAFLVALGALAEMFQTNVSGVRVGNAQTETETFAFCTQYSLGPAETLSFLVPGYFGWTTSSTLGPYWGRIGESISWADQHEGSRNLNLGISTIGTVPCLLALLGIGLLLPQKIARWFGPSVAGERQGFYLRWLLGLGLVALVLSWGYHTPLYLPLFHLPLMDKWRNPLKWLEVTNFCLVALAAFGAEQVLATVGETALETEARRLKLSRFLWGSVFGLLAFTLFSFADRYFLIRYLAYQGYQADEIVHILSTFHFSLFVALVEAILLLLLVRVLWSAEGLRVLQVVNPVINRAWQGSLQQKNLAATLALGLSLITVVQMTWVDRQFVWQYSYAQLTSTNPLLDTLANEGNLVRVGVAVQDMILNVFLQNQFAARNISSVDISAASRIPDDLLAFQNALKDEQARYWFLGGVKNLALPADMVPEIKNDRDVAANVTSADGFTLLSTASPDVPSHALVHLTRYLNKATLVSGAEFFPNEQALLQRLKDPNWPPLNSVLLLEKDRAAAALPPAPPSTQAFPSQVGLFLYTPQEIGLDVKSSTGGYLLINDHYDPDWKVEVNGQPAPLFRADFLLRGIALSPGSSRVLLHYRPSYHFFGLDLPDVAVNLTSDGAMLGGWLLAAGLLLWREKATKKGSARTRRKA